MGVMAGSAALAEVTCPTGWHNLRTKLRAAVAENGTNHTWAAVVNRQGVVCAVALSGSDLTSQWLLSRQIAAAKAFTTNGLNAIKTEVLDLLVQPGGALYGLAAGNPLDPAKIYAGPQSQWGTRHDPMVGEIVGGTITFGGGSPILNGTRLRGAIGISGDTAANNQIIADAVASTL